MPRPMIPGASADKLAFNEVWARSAPKRAYQVYVLRDLRDRVLYVGLTTQLKNRVYSHWRTQEWGREIAHIEVVEVVHGSYRGLLAERRWQEKLQPRYDKQRGKPLRAEKPDPLWAVKKRVREVREAIHRKEQR